MNIEKEKQAIQYIKSFEPQDGYYVCESGGKDSATIRTLCAMAGVKHELHHNLTTVDAPETVRYVRSIPGIIIHSPEKSMWRLIVEKGMPPTRHMRYCCKELKESGGKGRLVMTGVRWAESQKRAESSGLVKALGKPKETQRIASEAGANFRQTNGGGWF